MDCNAAQDALGSSRGETHSSQEMHATRLGAEDLWCQETRATRLGAQVLWCKGADVLTVVLRCNGAEISLGCGGNAVGELVKASMFQWPQAKKVQWMIFGGW